MKDEPPLQKKLPDDPHRKARFRDEARGIVTTDRHNRKYGMAVDTAGSIARALERAYKDGFVHGRSGCPVPIITTNEVLNGDAPVDWPLIPPRPRRAFWSICLFVLGHDSERNITNYISVGLLLITSSRGTLAWQIEGKEPRGGEFGDRTIAPLVRLDLLNFDGESHGRLVLTERGVSTWLKFLKAGGEFS